MSQSASSKAVEQSAVISPTNGNGSGNKISSLVDLVVCRVYQHAYQESEMRAEEVRVQIGTVTPDVKEMRAGSKDEDKFPKWGDITGAATARHLVKCEGGSAHIQLTAQGVVFVEQRLPPSVRCAVTPIAKLIKAHDATVRHNAENLTPVAVPPAEWKEGSHQNWVWEYSTDVMPQWKCFPPGDTLPVITPRNAGPHMIRSELLLFTRAARMKRDQYKHCKEYFDDAECSRGADCFFIHAVSVANLGPRWGRAKPLPDCVRNKPRVAPIPRSLIAAAVAQTTLAAAAAANGDAGSADGSNNNNNGAIGGSNKNGDKNSFSGGGGASNGNKHDSGNNHNNNKSTGNNKNVDDDDDDYYDDEDDDQPFYVSIVDVMLCRVYQRAVSQKARDPKATVRLSTITEELEKMRPQCYDAAALDKWQFVLEVCEGDISVNSKEGELSLTAKGVAHVEKILPDETVRKSLTSHSKLMESLDGTFELRTHYNYAWNSLAECKYERLKMPPAPTSSPSTVPAPAADNKSKNSSKQASNNTNNNKEFSSSPSPSPVDTVPAKLRVTVHDEPHNDFLIPAELILKTRATRVPRATYVHCAHYYKRESCELGSICKYVHAVSLSTKSGGKQWGKPRPVPPELENGKGPDPSDLQFVAENAKQAEKNAAVAAAAAVAMEVIDGSAGNKSSNSGMSKIVGCGGVDNGSKKSNSNVDFSSLLSPIMTPSASIGSSGFAPIVAPSSSSSMIDNSTTNDRQLHRLSSQVLGDDDDDDYDDQTLSYRQKRMLNTQQQQQQQQQQSLNINNNNNNNQDGDDDDDEYEGNNRKDQSGGKQRGRNSHQNKIYDDLSECPFERFDANAPVSETLQVEIANGGKLAAVPRCQLLKSGAVRIERRLYKHCKDFFDEGECHRGHKCKYVHMAFLSTGPVYGSFAKNALAQLQQQQQQAAVQQQQQQQQHENGGGAASVTSGAANTTGKKRYDVGLVDAMLTRLYQRAINSSSDDGPTTTVRANFVGDDLRELKQITRDGAKFDRLKDLIAGAQDRAQAYKGGADVALTEKGAKYVEDRGFPQSMLSQVSSKVEDLVSQIAAHDGKRGDLGVPAPRGGQKGNINISNNNNNKPDTITNNNNNNNNNSAKPVVAPQATTMDDFGFSVNSLSIPAPNSKQPVGGSGAADLKFNSDFFFSNASNNNNNNNNHHSLSPFMSGSHIDDDDDDDDLLSNLTPHKLQQKQHYQQQQQLLQFQPPLSSVSNSSNSNNNPSPDLQAQLRNLERDKTRLLEELVRAKERSDFADQEMQLLREKNAALVGEVQRLKSASAAVAAGHHHHHHHHQHQHSMMAGGHNNNNNNNGGNNMVANGGGAAIAFLPDRPHQVDFAACGLPQYLDPGTLVTAPERSPLREVAARLMRTGGSLLPRPSPVAGFTLESIDVLACDATGFEARVKRLDLARKTAARASAPYLELDSPERLHLYIALMERFLPRNGTAGVIPSQPNLMYVYQGTDLTKLSNVANGLLDASGTGPTAGLIGSGINVSTNIEFAAKEATGETDQSRPPPRRRTDGCVPVVWCCAAVGAAYPITRGDDFRQQKIKPGFDCHVAAINETNGFAGVVPRKDMQYQLLCFDQDPQVLPIAVLWLKEL